MTSKISAADFGFVGNQVGDAGRDTGGIYRNIAREKRVPNILSKGDYRQLSWASVCNSLSSGKNRDERVQVNIVDIVLFEHSSISDYVYSDTTGFISRKPKAMLSIKSIETGFMNFSELLQPSGAEYVAIANLSGEETQHLSPQAFHLLCHDIPSNLTSIHCFVPSKGNKTRWRTYTTTYWLDREARSKMKTEYLDMSAKVAGKTRSTSTANMKKESNKVMEGYMTKIVGRLQQDFQCRIVRMVADFVEDERGQIWFLSTSECVAANASESAPRTMSPDQMKSQRLHDAAHNSSSSATEVNLHGDVDTESAAEYGSSSW